MLRDAAQQALIQCGQTQQLSLAEYPSYLPVIGAARSVPSSDHGAAAVFDFGGTRAKRGIAFFDAVNSNCRSGALCRLRVLPPRDLGKLTWEGRTAELGATIVAIMADTIRTVEPLIDLAPTILCSVAACALAGRPNTAVLMMGSALGVGFVPPAEGYRPLAEQFALEQGQDTSRNQPGGGM
jgi:hypothetical protein